MRLTTRIALGLASLALLVVATAAYQLSLVRQLAAEHRVFTEITFEALARESRAGVDLDRLSDLGRKLIALRDPAYASALARTTSAAAENLERLADLELSTGERARADELHELWSAWAADAGAAAEAISAGRSPDGDLEEALVGSLAPLRRTVEALEAASIRHLETTVDRSRRRAESAERWAWLAGAAATVLALGIAAIVVLPFSRALKRLQRATVQLAEGNFAHRVRGGGGPELTRLAASFNAMSLHLEELDQLKRDFVSTVSHDLKGPLAAIEEATSLLLDEVPGPLTARQRHLLELDRASCRRLHGMIGDLLDLARLDAGAWNYEVQPCDLAELCRAAMETAAPAAEERQIEISLACPFRSPSVTADPASLQRVLDNLVSNAVKFSPPGSRAGIVVDHREGVRRLPDRVRRVGPPPATDGWLVEVWDSGPGIDDADKEKIFQRFQPLGRATGLGLGLSIARSVIRAHGGHVWVEDRPGGGCRFLVWLWPRPQPGWIEEELAGGATETRGSPGAAPLEAGTGTVPDGTR